jgi:hypothetical protein
MRRLLLLLLVVATTAMILPPGGATVAHACSGGGKPVEDSDVIVGGRVAGWTRIANFTQFKGGPELPFDDPNWYGAYEPIRVELAVDRVYKGTAPPTVEIIDGSSLLGNQWVGASGACGAFDSDPTGKYIIFGLAIDDFGHYRSNRLLNFHIGDNPPTDYSSSRFLGDLETLLPGSPPLVTSPSSSDSAPVLPIVTAGLVIPFAFLLGAALLWRRTHSRR